MQLIYILFVISNVASAFPTAALTRRCSSSSISEQFQRQTELFVFRRIFGRKKGKDPIDDIEPPRDYTPKKIIRTKPPAPGAINYEDQGPIFEFPEPEIMEKKLQSLQRMKKLPTDIVSVCVIGGGVSGLTAALTAAQGLGSDKKIMLLEGSSTLGGRVQSDVTEDGFILDRGFAVFIDEYPFAQQLLDYEALGLKKFLPGALVKVKGRNKLAKVADPFRQPEELIEAILAPVGSLTDKIALLPLIFHVTSKSVEDLFKEKETSTLDALKNRWDLGDDIVEKFFKPFLEGIYLAPLREQSSRMFSFVFKMFSQGSATLPATGIGAVAKQLAEKVQDAGVDIKTGMVVGHITKRDDGFLIESQDGEMRVNAKCLIVATDGEAAQQLLSQIEGFESLENLPAQPQRMVGCLYYAFKGPAPVEEPILILNGCGDDRGSRDQPVNNVCFPSVVNKNYAPEGYNLCSVTVLKYAMDYYNGKEKELDDAVRKQLATWFVNFSDDILEKWELKRIYKIRRAQPSQLEGPSPANVDGGRACNSYRGKELPAGVLVCGDHMATATLNGALESGVNAGKAAIKIAAK